MNLIAEEVLAGCMDGPFSIEEAHIIYGRHFRTCPLGLVEKPGLVDLHMIHHFSKEDLFGHSTNSWLNLDDFPTRWFTACQTADFVSYIFLLKFPLHISSSAMLFFHTACFYYLFLMGCGSSQAVFLHVSLLSWEDVYCMVATV